MYSAHSDDILPFLHLFQVLADGHNVFPSDIPKRQWKVISEGKSWATAQPLEKKGWNARTLSLDPPEVNRKEAVLGRLTT